LVPHSGNPVWLFPTARTDFANIHSAITSFELRSEALSGTDPQREEYNTEMLDIKQGIEVTKLNIDEAVPYTFVSITNIVAGIVWVSIIVGVFTVMKKAGSRRRQLRVTAVQV
jgi:hypothetical protein